jgi:hypothetical protein
MYDNRSPWRNTPILFNKILDIQKPRYIIKDPMDIEYTIPQRLDNRPDLLSYETYGTSKYWWIFALRNPDIIQDPINDFTPGKVIRIPKKTNIDRMG